VAGRNIHVYEQLDVVGGSLDGSVDAEGGYVVRGGRMFEDYFACTFDLLATIPSADDRTVSVADDIFAFNRMVPGSGNCRIVRGGKPAGDRFELTLTAQDIFDINRLFLHSEASTGDQKIDDWFKPTFFGSNFWLMWSTMFSFQPWHSAAEMRRYLRRFIHLFPGFTRIAGILRTRYNQYDSLIAPIVAWLHDRGVQIGTGVKIVDVTINGSRQDRRVSGLTLASGEKIEVAPIDQVYLTLGSMTDNATYGTNDRAPEQIDQEGGGWKLWRRLAAEHEGFGRPEVFCGEPLTRISQMTSRFTRHEGELISRSQ
jgi:oleate hydratase